MPDFTDYLGAEHFDHTIENQNYNPDGTPKFIASDPKAPKEEIGIGVDLNDYYGRIGTDFNIYGEDINAKRADTQSWTSQAFNAIVGGALSGVLTSIEDMSYILDLDNNIKRLSDLESVESNWLADLMKEGKQSLNKAMPIYRRDPNKAWDWHDGGSFWQALKGVMDSAVGFAIPGMAVSKGFSAAAKLARLSKYLEFLKTSKTGAELLHDLGAGYIMNFAEGKMMGLELYSNAVNNSKQQVYDNIAKEVKAKYTDAPKGLIDQKINVEFAKQLDEKLPEIEKAASDEANRFMLRNKVFMLSDMLGIHGALKGKGFIDDIIENPSIKQGFKKFFTLSAENPLLQATKEGAEEIGQNIIQSEGEYQTAKRLGLENKSVPLDTFKRIIQFGTSDQALIEGAMGFLGGAPQHIFVKSLTGQYGKKFNAERQNRYESQQWMMNEEALEKEGMVNNAWFLKNRLYELQQMEKLRKEALETGQDYLSDFLSKSMFYKVVSENFNRGTISNLTNQLKDIINSNLSQEELAEKGWDKDYKERAHEMLDEIESMRKEYIRSTKYVNAAEVFKTRKEIDLMRNIYNDVSEMQEYAKSRLETFINEENKRQNLTDNPITLEEIESGKNPGSREREQIIENIKSSAEHESYKYFDAQKRLASQELSKLEDQVKDLTSNETQYALRKKQREIIHKAKKVAKQVKAEKKRRENEEKAAMRRAKARRKKENRKNKKQSKVEKEPAQKDIPDPGQEQEQEQIWDPDWNPEEDEQGYYDPDINLETDKKAGKVYDPDNTEGGNGPVYDPATVNPNKLNQQPDVSQQGNPQTQGQNNLNPKGNKSVNFQNPSGQSQTGGVGQTNPQSNNGLTQEELDEIRRQESNSPKAGFTYKDAEDIFEEINDAFKKLIGEAIPKEVGNENKYLQVRYLKPEFGHNLLAYLSRDYIQYFDGEFLVREDVNNALTEEGFPASKNLLDPQQFTPGTQLKIVVRDDDNIPMYIPGTKKKTTWGAYKQSLMKEVKAGNISEKQYEELYRDFVPMVVTDMENVPIAFIHNLSWINEMNIYGDVKADRQALRALRKAVFTSNGQQITTTVKSKSSGYLIRYKDKIYHDLKEALPDENLTLWVSTPDGPVSSNEFNGKVINADNLTYGHTYAIIPVRADKSGELEYLAVPMNQKKLEGERQLIDTIRTALEIWSTDPSKHTEKQKAFIKMVFDTMGMNLLDNAGISDFVSVFLHNKNIQGNDSLYVKPTDKSRTGYLNQIDSDLIRRSTLMTFNNGTIEFSRGDGVGHIFLNKNTNKTQKDKFFERLEKRISAMYANVSANMMAEGKEIVLLDEKGSPVKVRYRDFLGNMLQSNIMAVNISDSETHPKWVYTIQPKVEIDTGFIQKEQTSGNENKTTGHNKPLRHFLESGDMDGFMAALSQELNEQFDLNGQQNNAELNTAMSAAIMAVNERLGTMVKNAFETLEAAAKNKEDEKNNPIKDEQYKKAQAVFDTYENDLRKALVNTLKSHGVKERATVETTGTVNQQQNTNQPKKKLKRRSRKGGYSINVSQDELEMTRNKQMQNFPDNLSEEQINEITSAIDGMVVEGVGAVRQSELVNHLALKFLRTMLDESDTSVKKVSSLKAFLEQELETLKENHALALEDMQEVMENPDDYDETDRLSLEFEVNLYQALIDNFDQVSQQVTDKILLYEGVTAVEDIDQDVQIEGSETESWQDSKAFTIDQKERLTPAVRKFLAFTRKLDANGNQVLNSWGFPEYEPFDKVFNILQRLTPGRRPSLEQIKEVLNKYRDAYPFMKDLLERLDKVPEHIQNQFITAMTNHYINMRFVLLKYDKNNNLVFADMSSNAYDVASVQLETWRNNLANKEEVLLNEEGEHYLPREMRDAIRNQIAQMQDNYKIGIIPSIDQLRDIFSQLGIELTDLTLEDIIRGNFVYKKSTLAYHMRSGLFYLLDKSLQNRGQTSLERMNLMSESFIKALALHDAQYSQSARSNSHKAGTKTVYSYGMNKYLINRFRELKEVEEAVSSNGSIVYVSPLLTRLAQTPFTRESLWLKELAKTDENGDFQYVDGKIVVDTEGAFYKNFDHWYASLEAIKKQFTNSRDNSELYRLSDKDNEIFRLAMLQASRKDASFKKQRIVRLLYPTTSDKTAVMGLLTKAFDISWNQDGTISKETYERLFDVLAAPEIERIRMVQEKKKEGIQVNNKEFQQGGEKFLVLPQLNNLKGMFLEDGTINPDVYGPEMRRKIILVIKRYVDHLVEEKLSEWEKFGIGAQNTKNKETLNFMDSSYLNTVLKSINPGQKVKAAATDMVLQYLVSNTEVHKMFTGDPALYYKSIDREVKDRMKADESLKEKHQLSNEDIDLMSHEELYDYYTEDEKIKQVQNTYINIGKRLGGDIGPGHEMADTYDDQITYAFLKDPTFAAKNIDELEKIFDGLEDKSILKAYSKIDTADAQEFTTWQEHLHVMRKLGKITEKEYNRFHKILSNGQTLNQSDLKKVLQPMKPVYVNNVKDASGITERRLYVKSSSFPLIPQLTKGFELDKLRQAMERDKIDRVAFETAVKVGGISNAADIWEKDGRMKKTFSLKESSLTVPRAGFRIQQDVPYKADKSKITRVTQASKNLFVNMLHLKGFKFREDGQEEKEYTGQELQKVYMHYNKEIMRLSQKRLMDELTNKDNSLSLEKLHKILIREARERGYSLSDKQLIEMDKELKYFMFAPSASKFEALLNSIITNRILKLKMPGTSLVQGTSEGFKVWEDEKDKLDENDIVFTPYWNGKELEEDQVFVPFRFFDSKGNRLDVRDFVKDGKLDLDKVPKELLQIFGMRIPNQGPNSQRSLKIAGFLPEKMGDLVIVPRSIVPQMGSDFDVDKLFAYMYHTTFKGGKLSKFELSDVTGTFYDDFYAGKLPDNYYSFDLLSKDDIQNDQIVNAFAEHLADKLANDKKLVLTDEGTYEIDNKSFDKYEDLIDYVKERVLYNYNKFLETHKPAKESILITVQNRYEEKRVDAEIKHYQNRIIDIYHAIHSNQHKEVQRIINTPISEWKLKELAKEVENARNNRQKAEEGKGLKYFIGISDGYQKMKFINATAGKSGVGIFSQDSMFNTLVQGKDIFILDAKGNPLKVAFGKRVSNGNLSRVRALDDKTYISDVISGYQSAAVDNEKLQVLDKLNINSETFPIIKLLNQLGFLEEVPLFISQDIIVDFTNELNNMRSKVGDYVPNAEDLAYKKVIAKYKAKLAQSDKNFSVDNYYEPSAEKMRAMIINGNKETDYYKYQIALLDKFLELKEYGIKIGVAQSLSNVDSAGIPKSFLETYNKYANIKQLNKAFKNGEHLLVGTVKGEVTDFTSISGLAIQYGLQTAVSLYSRFNYFGRQGVQEIVKHLEWLSNKDFKTAVERNNFDAMVWEELKSYLFANKELYNFDKSGNFDDERTRLLYDKWVQVKEDGKTKMQKEHLSLASIVEIVKELPGMKANAFIQKLEPKPSKRINEASEIKMNAAVKEDWDDTNTYLHFLDLLINERSLGTFNGREYTTRDLAQDLIFYTYATGGVQKAVQFTKYVPPVYLKTIGFFDFLDRYDFSDASKIGGVAQWEKNPDKLNTFIVQFFQHHPEYVTKVAEKDVRVLMTVRQKLVDSSAPGTKISSSRKTSLPYTIQLKNTSLAKKGPDGKEHLPQFIALEKQGADKRNIVLYVHKKNEEYVMLGSVGSYAVKEYNQQGVQAKLFRNIKDIAIQKIVQQKDEEAHMQSPNTPEDRKEKNIDSRNTLAKLAQKPGQTLSVANILTNILENPEISEANKAVAALAQRMIQDMDSIRVVLDENQTTAGRYNSVTKTLSIKSTPLSGNLSINEAAEILLHEIIHHPTSLQVKKYQRMVELIRNGKDEKEAMKIVGLNEEQVKVLRRLNNLFYDLKDRIGEFKTWQEAQKNKPENKEDLYEFTSKNYWKQDLAEFVTMALTNRYFQEMLNAHTYKENVSWLDKILEIVNELFNAMGFNVVKGSALDYALKDVISLIDMNYTQTQQTISEESTPKRDDSLDRIVQINHYKIHVAPDGSMYFKNGNPVTDETIQRKIRIKLAFEDKQGKVIRHKSSRYFVFNDGVIISLSSFKEYKGDGRETILQAAGIIPKQHIEQPASEMLEETPVSTEQGTREINGSKVWSDESGNYFQASDGTVISTGSFQLSKDQQTVLQMMIDDIINGPADTFSLRGFAGTGKTTSVQYLLKYLKKVEHPLVQNITVAAPTHKAKHVVYVSVLKSRVKTNKETVARLIGRKKLRGQWVVDPKKSRVPTRGLMIIDESSMLNEADVKSLISLAHMKGSKIIFMGDPAQIPPVGSRSISSALRQSHAYEMTQEQRQEGDNPLIDIYRKVRTHLKVLSDSFPLRTNINAKGEGLEVVRDSIPFIEKALGAFGSIEELKKNPTKARIIAYTNSAVKSYNEIVRTHLLADKGLTKYQKGELMMGYAQQSDESEIENGQDYIIEDTSYGESKDFTLDKGFIRFGYGENKAYGDVVTLKPVGTNENNVSVFILDTEDERNQPLFDALVGMVQRSQDFSLPRQIRLDYYFAVQDIFQTFHLPDTLMVLNNQVYSLNTLKQERPELFRRKNNVAEIDKLLNSLSIAKLEKTIDYGYAITVHKVQGSTYQDVYIDWDDINNPATRTIVKEGGKDFAYERNQLKYVALSRPTKKAVIMTHSGGGQTISATQGIDLRNLGAKDTLDPLYASESNDDLHEKYNICK